MSTKRRIRGTVVVATAVLMISVVTIRTYGKKNQSNPAPGKILFRYQENIWQVNADGSERVPIISADVEFDSPSAQTYDGVRWFLTTKTTHTYDTVILPNGSEIYDQPHYDLFARAYINGEVCDVQLTDYYKDYCISPPRNDRYRLSQPTWSNDGKDSFVTVLAEDVRDAVTVDEESGAVTLDTRNSTRYWARLRINGSDIAAIAENNTPITTSDDLLEAVISCDVSDDDTEVTCVRWSPDNRQLVAITSEIESTFSSAKMWVVGSPVESEVPCLPNDGELIQESVASRSVGPIAPAWSPDGTCIAFYLWTDGSTVLCTIEPDSKELTPVYDLTFHDAYNIVDPIWSPDSKYLVLGQARMRGWDLIYSLKHIGLSDGAIVDLTKRLDVYEKKIALSWTD